MGDNSSQNGWNEYSRLVLKELETLSASIDDLREDLQDVKQEITKIQVKEDNINQVREWKAKIDEISSPTQLKEYLLKVDELIQFKTKSVTVFMVVQFIMALAVALTKVFS
jgi:prefoldin subunit 5